MELGAGRDGGVIRLTTHPLKPGGNWYSFLITELITGLIHTEKQGFGRPYSVRSCSHYQAAIVSSSVSIKTVIFSFLFLAK